MFFFFCRGEVFSVSFWSCGADHTWRRLLQGLLSAVLCCLDLPDSHSDGDVTNLYVPTSQTNVSLSHHQCRVPLASDVALPCILFMALSELLHGGSSQHITDHK